MTGSSKTIPWRDRLLPTSTVSHARLQFFQPTFFPKLCERQIQTPYGDGVVKGKLGMTHALLLELINFYAIRTHVGDDKALHVLFDLHDIRSGMSRAGGRYSREGLTQIAADLKMTAIIIPHPSLGGDAIDGVLDRLVPTRVTRVGPFGDRVLWRAQLSPAYRAIIENDVPLHYDPTPIGRLRNGVSAAVARWVLTQRDTPRGGWHLNTILQAVGAPIDGAAGRKRRFEVRADSDGLVVAGVDVRGDRVFKSVLSTPAGVLSTPAPFSPRPQAFPGRPRR